jgi:hypothetical protein
MIAPKAGSIPMNDRISVIGNHLLKRLIAASLLLGLAAAGCGADQGTTVTNTAPQPVPDAVKGMRENLKQQMAAKKGAGGQQQRPASPGN